MPAKYASQTNVAPERSRAEIEHILVRYGADQFLYGRNENGAVIGFRFKAWLIRFTLPLPSEREMINSPAGRRRKMSAAIRARDQETLRRWRSLALAIKAKLDTVETGIATFETEFLSYILLPNGQTAGEWLTPQLKSAYEARQMPELLPMLPAPNHERD